MTKSFVISLLLISVLNAQPFGREGPPGFHQPFQSETIIIPAATDNLNLFYTFKIPYSGLVFERNDGVYSAGLRVLVEITDSTSKLVKRDIRDAEITVDNFEATNERSIFLQDYLKFVLGEGKYILRATVTDLNSQNEIRLPQVELDLNNNKHEPVLHPLIIKGNAEDCDEENAFTLANFGGDIPFSPEDFHLILPVSDTSADKIMVTILNNEDTLITRKVEESYTVPVGISKCGNTLVVHRDESSKLTRNFLVRDVNRNLIEGMVRLQISFNDSNDAEFKSEVVWLDKPFSLFNPEMAIELLSFIEPDSVIYRMLKTGEAEYPKVLREYWTPFDPTPHTSFNQLMAEYYKRVDYAAKEFRGLGKDDGIKTDRGLIYIRFGKPDSIERSSNNQGQVIETWTYKNPDRKFVFVDKKGTGNFTLVEN